MLASAATNNTFYTPKQVCDLLQISLSTFRRFVRNGDIEAIKIGHSVRVSEQALERFLTASARAVK